MAPNLSYGLATTVTQRLNASWASRIICCAVDASAGDWSFSVKYIEMERGGNSNLSHLLSCNYMGGGMSMLGTSHDMFWLFYFFQCRRKVITYPLCCGKLLLRQKSLIIVKQSYMPTSNSKHHYPCNCSSLEHMPPLWISVVQHYSEKSLCNTSRHGPDSGGGSI